PRPSRTCARGTSCAWRRTRNDPKRSARARTSGRASARPRWPRRPSSRRTRGRRTSARSGASPDGSAAPSDRGWRRAAVSPRPPGWRRSPADGNAPARSPRCPRRSRGTRGRRGPTLGRLRRARARWAPGRRSSGCDTSPTIPGASWCPSPSTSQNDFRSDAFAGEELEQDRVLLTAVDDVSLAGSALQGAERGLDLGQHAAVDHAFLYKALRLLPGQGADEAAVEVEDPLDVGKVDQLLGAQSRRDVACDEIRVDVVRFRAAADPDRRDDRDHAIVRQELDGVGVDPPDVPSPPARKPMRSPACPEEPGVLARKADRLAPVVIDAADDLLVDLTDQHHLDDLDRFLIGHAH